MVDDDGLCRSMLCAATLAPWTNDDLAKTDQRRITDMFQNATDKAGCMSYENALMATSEFALSQITRHRVTKEEPARELAHRGIRGILAVIEEGRHYMPGWLPKPFGGVSHARDSHEMSVDQYTKAIIALHAWRPLAGQGRAGRDRPFLHRRSRLLHRTEVAARLPAPHHCHRCHASSRAGLVCALVQLAAQASGDDRYLAQLTNFDDAITAALANEGLESGFNGISLIVEGFHAAMQAGCTGRATAPADRAFMEAGSKCVDEQGRGFIPREPPVFDSQGPRLAAIATIVESQNPNTHATDLAQKILGSHRDPAQMKHTGDLTESIAEVSITSWLVAYWRLREAVKS